MTTWFSSIQGLLTQMVDTLSPINTSQSKPNITNNSILFAGFNQNCSCVCVGTLKGFRIYQCKPFALAFESEKDEQQSTPIKQVSMLFATSLVALVGYPFPDSPSTAINHRHSSSARNVKLFNTKNRQELCRLNFKSTVLNLRMNKSRLAICTERKIHLFDLNSMKIIHEINTCHNPTGIFDLCCDDDNCLLAYPELLQTTSTFATNTNHNDMHTSNIYNDPPINDQEIDTHLSRGRIGILDAFNLQIRTIIIAHDSPLHMIAFNADGNYIASASQFGTLIRVFALPSGKHLYSFRRGSYPTHIECLAFNPSTTFLCCSSKNSNTIHIFNLNSMKRYEFNSKQMNAAQSTINATLNSTLNIMSDYIPTQLRNSIEHPRSFAHIVIKATTKIESIGGSMSGSGSGSGGGSGGNSNSSDSVSYVEVDCDRIVCGFLNDHCIVVATYNGYFYRYSIPVNGGHCKLLSEHTLYHWSVMDDEKYAVTKIFVNEMNDNVVERKVVENENESGNVVEKELENVSDLNVVSAVSVDVVEDEDEEFEDESSSGEEDEEEDVEEIESEEVTEDDIEEYVSEEEKKEMDVGINVESNVGEMDGIYDDQSHNMSLGIDCDLSEFVVENTVNSNLNLMDLFDSLSDSDDDGNETQSSVNE